MKYLIHVPATTANLGPGFDCLGLALDIWNDLEVSVEGHGLSIEINGVGANHLPRNEENAIFSAMQGYAAFLKKELPHDLRLVCTNRIPLGSGLGSSSAAVVAGMIAANAVLNGTTKIEDQLAFATALEGHPDNVAPCLLGGLVTSIINEGRVITNNLMIADFNLVLVHPFFNFPTSVARAALPIQVSRCDAIFNTSHAILVIEALRSGNLELLKVAMQDRLHQPYRLPCIPGAEKAIEAASEVGAVVTILSGAGPSLLSFSPTPDHNHSIAAAIQKAFQQEGIASEVFFPAVSQCGASLSTLD
jgi:homoserine kinase